MANLLLKYICLFLLPSIVSALILFGCNEHSLPPKQDVLPQDGSLSQGDPPVQDSTLAEVNPYYSLMDFVKSNVDSLNISFNYQCVVVRELVHAKNFYNKSYDTSSPEIYTMSLPDVSKWNVSFEDSSIVYSDPKRYRSHYIVLYTSKWKINSLKYVRDKMESLTPYPYATRETERYDRALLRIDDIQLKPDTDGTWKAVLSGDEVSSHLKDFMHYEKWSVTHVHYVKGLYRITDSSESTEVFRRPTSETSSSQFSLFIQ